VIGRALRVAVLLLLAAATVRADYQDSFKRGIQAFNRGQWAVAVRELTAAIAQKGENSGERINISGMDFVRYFPHYYLGLAHAAADNCAGALQAWRALDDQNAAARLAGDERRQLAASRQKCEQQLPPKPKPEDPKPKPDEPKPKPEGTKPPEPRRPDDPPRPDPAALAVALQQAEGAIAQADDARRRVVDLAADDLLRPVWRSDNRLGAAQDDAESSLKSARGALADAKSRSSVERARDAAAAANSARAGFEGIVPVATARLSELRLARDKKPEPPPAPPNPTKPRVVPPALLRAADLYFSGRYAEAAGALDGQRYTDTAESLQAEVFRAASAFGLYVIGGERDPQLRERATASVRACRRLDPRFAPDTASFSPRFVQFYRDVR
jgi:hypothetical protein